MEPKKYDSFTPKRATNIDGFFAAPPQHRQRIQVPPATIPPSPIRLQPSRALPDMPSRPQQQTSLGDDILPPIQTAAPEQPLPREGRKHRGKRRDRGRDKDRSEPAVKERKSYSWKRLLKRTGKISGVVVLLLAIFLGFHFYKDISRLTGNSNPFSLLGAFNPVPLKSQDGRVNILVAGNSADDTGHNGADLTDSIMVLSLNTKNNTALMLSVPRDLYVNIPGVGHSKINAAYANGGMDKLQSVVEENLDMTIDYQVLVNYGAFRDLVDAVGGINITIDSDDPRGIYDPSLDYTSRKCCALAKYPNGPATLNGKEALNLARARGDAAGSYGYAQSDFTRTMYQRKMLIAVKDKASQSSVVANPFKVTRLIDAASNNVRTDLSVAEIQTLYTYMKKVDDNKIDSYNINTLNGKNSTLLANYSTTDGQSALIPAAGLDDFTDIQAQIKKIFTADPITKEGATVVVLNATETSGLASKQLHELTKKGMTATIGDASADQAVTTIVDNSDGDMPNTLAYLKQKYTAEVAKNTTATIGYPGADFIVILGQNAVPKTTSTTSKQ